MAKHKVVTQMMGDFLYYDKNGEKKEKVQYIDLKIQTRELLRYPFNRDVLIAVLLDLRKYVARNTKVMLFRMYQVREPKRDTYRKRKRWFRRYFSKVISETKQVQVRNSCARMTSFVSDRSSAIKKQAALAAVALRKLAVLFEEGIPLKINSEVVASKEETVKSGRCDQNKKLGATKIIFSDAIASETLVDFLVSYVEIQAETAEIAEAAAINEEIDWSTAFETSNDTPIIKNTTTFNANEEPKPFGETCTIPIPLFYNTAMLKRIVLLEDIAELGDHREIPFLRSLLNHRENAPISKRISELITALSDTDRVQTSNLRQSVFQSLIEIGDTESKLILIHEIAAIGDEIEIPLLRQLTMSEDIRIYKSAITALEKLYDRIGIGTAQKIVEDFVENDDSRSQGQEDLEDVFSINFDIDTALKKTATGLTTVRNHAYGNTKFDRLCAISTKLYTKEPAG